MKYFSNLPIISYANNLSRNILSRVKISNTPTYYPYTMNEGQRIEHIAYDYYNDSDDVWILHHVNNVIDPYFDYSLNQIDFDRYIEKKYGSLNKAQRDIAFYHTNYYNDDSTLDVSEYNNLNTISASERKYWAPVLDLYGNPYEYVRSKEDIVISTNKIISANITLTTNATFITGEKVTQSTSGGTAFVAFSNSSMLTIQHITGTINANNITGNDSGAIATVQDVTTISTPISQDEFKYFTPISYYDYELDMNTKKKNINVLDKSYTEIVSSQFRQLLNG